MTPRLIVADSETNADMLYATRLFVPDPFVYFEKNGKKHIVVSDLEIDRARAQATVDRVLSYTRYQNDLKKAGVKSPRLSDVLRRVLKEFRIRRVQVPSHFPFGLTRKLNGVKLELVPGAFFPDRIIKTALEVRQLAHALHLAEQGMTSAMRVLKHSRIGKGGALYWRGERLRSEHVRGVINATIAGLGGVAAHTIVACGNQACDPHEAGHGPLRAHQTIIIDIFPRETRTGYWGDITRTVVRGRASDQIRKMFAAVHNAQELAFQHLRDGVDGGKIHQAIHELFRRDGFKTGRKNGYMQGFFHGTGHGLGLEIHEAPRVSQVTEKLRAGMVVTVEPGLYYRGIGGVRLEDVAVIQKNGARNLTQFPKFLEI